MATVTAVVLSGMGAGAASASRPTAEPASPGPAAPGVGAQLPECGVPPTQPSYPDELVDVGGTLFFNADDGVHGRELWRSDGTEVGTVLVKDIRPGSFVDLYLYPRNLTAVGDTLFFTADDGTHGEELWRSDGTEAGTVQVSDIRVGSRGAFPDGLTEVGDTLFFTADDGTHGRELWRSDGTEAGTVLVKDIVPRGGDSAAEELTDVGGTLFFNGRNSRGWGLWKTDGTAAGTVLVKGPGRGGIDTYGSDLAAAGGTLFFTAEDRTHGDELWRSDGTRVGTSLVRDIRAGSSGSLPWSLTEMDGALFFSASDGPQARRLGLWRSDGTETGTVLVRRIGRPAGYGLKYLTDTGGTLFFTANDGTHGQELWRSDGTGAGTVMVEDIASSPDADYPPAELTNVAGTLFFTTDDDTHGRELWRSDGTEAGTYLVRDIRPGSRDDYDHPSALTGVDGRLLFAADDGARDGGHGAELWTSDGTEAGTHLVDDINAVVRFRVVRNGQPNTRAGTLRVAVTVSAPGRLVADPAGGSPLRRTARQVDAASKVTVTIRPTRAGLRTLRHTGKLRVRARFTFTPCAGTSGSVVRPFTLHLE